MDKIYKKITSIDIGSTNSQMAQRYAESTDNGATWSYISKPEEDKYFLKEGAKINYPTELILKEDLTPDQLTKTGMDKEMVFGVEAQELHKTHYQLPIVREFKKDLYYSEEEKERDSSKAEKYRKAVKYTELFLRGLKEREELEEEKDCAQEVTYVTVPVRATMQHRELMRELAEKAGWKNVEVRDEADSVLRYALGNRESSLFKAVSNLTDRDKLRMIIMDIGGSTTDLLLVGVGPDGQGSYAMDRLAVWPEVGEEDTLGGIDIDKKICEWLLKEKYILPELAEQSIGRFGYQAFRKFKENESVVLKMGDNNGVIPQLEGDVTKLCGSKKIWAENEYDEDGSKKINREVYANEIADEYVGKLQKAIRTLLSADSAEEEEIDFVVLAGGGSLMYGIEEMLLGKFPVENPLRLVRIDKDKGTLISIEPKSLLKEASSICALGNVMPALPIPYRKYSFMDYRLIFVAYAAKAGTVSEWDGKVFSMEPAIPQNFSKIYRTVWQLAKAGDILPVKVNCPVVDQEVTIKRGDVVLFVLKLYSVKDGCQQFQRGWAFDTMRTLGKLIGDKFSDEDNTKLLNAEIAVQIDEELLITVFAKAKIQGYWGTLDTAEKRNANG